MTFGSRLSDALADRGRFCAGIDPHPGLLEHWGLTDSVNGLEKFAMTAVESFATTDCTGRSACRVPIAVSAQKSQAKGQPRVASSDSGKSCLRATSAMRGTGTSSAW